VRTALAGSSKRLAQSISRTQTHKKGRVTVMEPVDPSKKHFYISMVKSAIRICAGGVLCFMGNDFLIVTGVLIIAAEVLGIAEEL